LGLELPCYFGTTTQQCYFNLLSPEQNQGLAASAHGKKNTMEEIAQAKFDDILPEGLLVSLPLTLNAHAQAQG
jgi:hypothetical protein